MVGNGQAVIETLIIPGDGDDELDPTDRYANMRNVHHLPTEMRLLRWMRRRRDFGHADIVNITATTIEEQRATEWMPFHSLAKALSKDGGQTVERHPAPLRAVLVASVGME